MTGGTLGETERPARDWIRGTYRVLQTVDVEVRRLRRREIGGLLKSGLRSGAFSAINSDRSEFPATQGALLCPLKETRALAHLPTRLSGWDAATQQRLVNWGYASADAGLRSYVDTTLPAPAQFPYSAGLFG